MNFLKHVFLLFCLWLTPCLAFAASSECTQYTNNCDMLAACEIYQVFAGVQSGLAPDYNTPLATNLNSVDACKTYPDKFKKDIDVTIDGTQIKIAWATVRDLMKNNGIPSDQNQTTGTNNTSNNTSSTDSQNGDLSNSELLDILVNAFGPDTKEQEAFFKALAGAYITAEEADHNTMLDDAFVLNFLGEGNNLDKYKAALITLTGETKEPDLNIDVSWDDVLIEVSNVMDTTLKKNTLLVCENNRSLEGLIDIVGWVVTAVAAVLTFYTGGAGGAAVAAGRAALGAGLKASAKAVAKAGGKAAVKQAAKKGAKTAVKKGVKKSLKTRLKEMGGKQLAKSAQGLGHNVNVKRFDMFEAAKFGRAKGLLKGATKTFVKQVGKNLKNKWTLLAGAGAVIYQTGGGAGTLYSIVSSDADKEIVNCQDLDHNEGCYTVCGDNLTGYKGKMDLLNSEVLKPVTGKTYCVKDKDYGLYEYSGGKVGKRIILDTNQMKKVKSNMKKIQDKRPCDWNEDDIDAYYGFFVHDPDTLDATTDAMIIEDIFRIDD